MEKNKVRIVVIIFFISFILVFAGVSRASWWFYQVINEMIEQVQEKESFSFKAHDEALDNPARGFYMQIYYLEADRIQQAYELGHKLVLVTMGLEEFIHDEIPPSEIEKLRSLFQEAREHGIMLIFRAAYLNEPGGEEPELTRIRSHIKQLSEVMNEYKDVILVVQTGMVGLWGEWHGSEYLRDEETIRNEAVQVVRWWLQELDESISLNLRRPWYIELAKQENCDTGRLGMHNDALLSTDSDMGTYFDRVSDLKWAEENLSGRINGGEMPYVSEYTEIENVRREFDQLSITYLNAYYNAEVLDQWSNSEVNGENALTYIGKRLGYRYHVKDITVNKKLYTFTKRLKIDITLENTGFASVDDRFHLYLVCDDGMDKTFIRLDKLNSEKRYETFTYTIEAEKWEPFSIGLCYMDADADTYNAVPENTHVIEFANDDMQYKDGINYFLKYEYEDETAEEYEMVCRAERFVN